MKRGVWISDLSWAVYLLGLAVLFGLAQHWPLVQVARQGELPAFLTKLRQERREITFQGVRTINLTQAYAFWEEGQTLFLDARKPDDYAELHIEGALNLPPGSWENNPEITALAKVPKDRRIVVYCSQAACDDALKAAEKLQSQGFSQVTVFLGGFRIWDEAGYPVDTRF
jgi:rhodanese-related sulfurtransferase